MEFTVLDNEREITEAHDRVVARLTGASTEKGVCDINPSPGSYRKNCEAFWLGNHGIYFSTNFTQERKVKCFADFFGADNPRLDTRKQINKVDIMINAPTSQVHMATSGQFLKDQNGSVYYAHIASRGNVKGSKPDHRFTDWYPGPAEWVDVTSGGKKYKMLKISAIESPTFVEDMACYVKAWREFRDFVKTPEYADLVGEPVGYWMVRAGKGGEDWPNQPDRDIAAIHYYSIDLAKCTNKDGTLSEGNLRKKVEKMAKKKLTNQKWGAVFGELESIFSVKKGARVCLMNPDTWKFLVGTCKRTYKYEADDKKYPNPHTVKVAWDDKVERTLPEYFKSRFSRSIKDLEKEEYDLIMSSRTPPTIGSGGSSGGPGGPARIRDDCQVWADFDEHDNPGGKGYYDILKRKRNLIFYGPPGTGKTWTARQLAECLCEENGSAFQEDLASVLQTQDPGTFEERLIEQLEKDANAEGFSFEKRPDVTALQKHYSLKGDGGEEIRVGIHSSEETTKSTQPESAYFQVGYSEIAWFKENPDNKNFLVLYKKGIEAFVCIPFETEQDFSKFGGAGDGTGGWDPTGEGKHQVHNLKFDNSMAHFDMKNGSTNRPDDKKDKDVTEGLNTWGFDSCVFSVTFHPSYSYEDFVEGFRPKIQDDRATLGAGGVAFPYHVDGQQVTSTSTSQYELAEGIFRIACDHARSHPGRKTVLLIDEINRGNIPKIFGELITLIEKDKRSSKYAVRLAYSKKTFFVPYNLYIIGTMNTADKSLVQMDDALKRRFAFEELMPDMDVLKDHLSDENVNDAGDYLKILENINKKILNHNKTAMKQFRDRQIGHSYFWDIKDDDDLKFVIKYEVIPLLQDYFYNDYGILRRILGTGEKDYRVIGKDNRPTDLVKNGTMKIKDNQYNENAGTSQNLRSVLLDLDPASTDTASNDTASNDTASNDTASNDTASNDTDSNDTASNDTDSNDTDSNDTDSNDTDSDGTNNN